MEIEPSVESLVREALAAVVEQDLDRLGGALRAFTDNHARRAGLELTVAVAGLALLDRHDGTPSEDDVRRTAGTVAERARWIGVTAGEAEAYLTSLVDGTPLEEALDRKAMVPLIFVITGTLLAVSPRAAAEGGEGGEDGNGSDGGDGGEVGWSGYLDLLEAQLAAIPT